MYLIRQGRDSQPYPRSGYAGSVGGDGRHALLAATTFPGHAQASGHEWP